MSFTELITKELIIGCLWTAFMIAVAPVFFPGNHLPTSAIELIARYIYGTAAALLGVAIYATGGSVNFIGIFMVFASAGLIVVCRYLSKYIREMWFKAKNHERRRQSEEKELKEILK